MTAVALDVRRPLVTTGTGEIDLPVASLDRMASGGHILGVLGPLELPSREALVDAMHRIVASRPESRVGLVGAGEGRWRWSPDELRGLCERMVTEIGPTDDLSPARVLEHLVDLIDPELPMRVIVSGDRLLTIADHGVVDGFVNTRLPLALVEVAGGGDVPDWSTETPSRRPLAAALLQTFVRRPRTVVALLRARRAEAAVSTSHVAPSLEQVAWTPATTAAWGTVDKAATKALQTWLRAQPRPLSFSSALLVGLRTALAREGVRLSPESEMIYDVRRWLPSDGRTTGNFVTGLPVTGIDDLVAVDHSIRETVASARPLAALAVGALKEALRPADHAAVARTAPAHARGRVVLSNVGIVRQIEKLPWVRGGRPTEVAYTVHPIAPQTLAVQAVVRGGRLQVTLGFNDNAFDRDVVERAVARFAADPLSLLDGAPGA